MPVFFAPLSFFQKKSGRVFSRTFFFQVFAFTLRGAEAAKKVE